MIKPVTKRPKRYLRKRNKTTFPIRVNGSGKLKEFVIPITTLQFNKMEKLSTV